MNRRTRLFARLVAFMTLLAAGFLWWQSDRSQARLREEVMVQAGQRSLHLADAMGGQVQGLLNLLDAQLLVLRRDWLRDPAQFDAVARDTLKALPAGFVELLSVTDARGEVIYNSLDEQRPMSDSDRDHFRVHLTGEDGLHIGKPVLSRPGGGWVFVVNRPILREGRFAGTVNLQVSTEFVSARLAMLQLSQKDVVALIHQDGTFMARSRDNAQAMGTRLPLERPFLRESWRMNGIFHVPGLLDGTARTYGWQRLLAPGLIVSIGLADEAVLAPLSPAFERGRAVMAALAGLLVACGGLIVVLMLRLSRQQATMLAGEALRMRMFESSLVPTVVIDAADHSFIECNPAACKIYGVASRQDLVGKTPAAFSAPVQYDGTPSAEKVRFYIDQACEEDGVVFEWRHQRPNGEQWDGEVHLMAFKSEGRWLLQFTMHDITQRKLTEAALKDSEARLQEAQRLAHIGNWQVDLSDNRLTWSDEVFRIFELDPATVVPTYKHFILGVHPDDRAMVAEVYKASVDMREPFDMVHRLLMPDGRVKHVHESGFTQFEGDRPLYSVGTVQDITEVRTAEEALRRLNDELEQRVAERTREMSVLNRELEAFAYSVSHDLRTPLRSIDGFANLLEEDCGPVLSVEGRTYVNRIRTSSRRMGRLISDLLALAHLSRTELRLEPVDLTRMARTIAGELSGTDPARDMQWHIDEDMQVMADPGLMQVVVQNLLGNAWKYTGQTPRARVSFTRTLQADGTVVFCVRDNGAGFNMAYVDQLFEPFKRLHAHNEFEGSGVGLATVYRVIERHGGWVRGEGAVGLGASFCFSVPAA